MNRSSRALQNYSTDKNHCEHQIRLVSTYFPLHRQDVNIHARCIHRACCSGDCIPAEERCSWDTDIVAVLDLVRSESTSDVYLCGYEAIDDQYPKHTPDASFAHADSQYPSIVIETSYSQHHKELPRLADEYISGSNGNIAVILGKASKRARKSSCNSDYRYIFALQPSYLFSLVFKFIYEYSDLFCNNHLLYASRLCVLIVRITLSSVTAAPSG